jgi:NADH:ubiquinone oxidoreductase subunit C
MTDTEAASPQDGAEADAVEPAPELHGHPVTVALGETTVHAPREGLVELVRTLRDEGWIMCLDVTAVDHLANAGTRLLPEGVTPERFEVAVLLINHREPARLRVKVQVPEDDATLPSLFEVHPGTEAMEREVFDMFGIAFEGHPDLTRILMPEDWIGHPLRKDYAVGRIPVQFKGDPGPR